jgi:hypothetical protein
MATVSPGFTCPLRTPHSKPVGKMSLSITIVSSSALAGKEQRLPSVVWDAHVLGLCSVDSVAQNPAAVSTMGIHASFAEVALQAGGDARDDDLVSNVKL